MFTFGHRNTIMYFSLFVCLLLIEKVTLIDVTYYEVLGVTKQSNIQEIKQAYKKLVVKFHPDKNPDASQQEKFIKITEAYETLKDPEKRRNYDLYGNYNAFTRKYDTHSQSEYNNLYYNGLYNGDPFVDTLTPKIYYNYLSEGFYFINYYSPFCPPCQNLVEHWKKVAEVYKGIVKVGAVNCKYYNNFCYNSMRISSYPSLLFYPNGKNGNFIYYRGDRTFEALDQFVMTYLNSQVHVPVIVNIRKSDEPMAYVLGDTMIESNTLTRIAYQLKGLVTVVIVLDELRQKLTKDDSVTIVLKYRNIKKELTSTEERDIVKQIINSLPSIEQLDIEKLKEIRNQMRSGHKVAWVLYFTNNDEDKLTLHQLRTTFPDLHFGEIDCSKFNDLCVSLQVEDTPTWAVLKRAGGYQKAPKKINLRSFIRTAVETTRLHTLSSSEFTRILYGDDVGTWVLLVVPNLLSYEDLEEPFAKTSLQFIHSDRINFGIMACTQTTDKYCRQVAYNQAVILVQNGTKRFNYNGRIEQNQLYDFIGLIKESPDLEVTEQQVLEILDPSREQTWLLAFLPSQCGEICDDLLYEWLVVAEKLKPLNFVKAGVLRCNNRASFCSNIRTPTARLYPIASGQHYTLSLQQVSQAPYILEWAMERIDDSVQKLSWHTFSKKVIVEELHPTSGKKPWLVYFHSPRCYRCYEMYSEFAIAGIHLNNAVNLGKVNCLSEQSLCHNEHINSYPSLKLYLNRNKHQQFSSTINLQVRSFKNILEDVKKHLSTYDSSVLEEIRWGVKERMSHDEF